jgi:integrase
MAELSLLVADCQGSLRTETMIRAMAKAGLRRGWVIGLQRQDIDPVGLRLHVRRSVSDLHEVRQKRTTKGKRSRRVAISESFAARLATWKVRSGGARATGTCGPDEGLTRCAPTHPTTRLPARCAGRGWWIQTGCHW